MKKTYFEKKLKNFLTENFWPRLVLLYRNETPSLQPLAMRSEQGESPISDHMQRGVSAFGISLPLGSHCELVTMHLKVGKFFSLKLISEF